MNMKKFIIGGLTLFVVGYYFYPSIERKVIIDVETDEFIAIKKSESNYKLDPKLKIKTKQIALPHINELFSQLKPPSNEDLEQLWQDEYGCYDHRLQEESDCKYTFLSAKSLKEALWMKRNGYPTIEMLNLAKDESNKELLNELIKAKHPYALIVAAVLAQDKGDIRKAVQLAGSAEIYAGIDKTYPHVLYGETMIANNPDVYNIAIDKFIIAGLLGDKNAESMGIRLARNNIELALSMKSAYAYILRNFGRDFPVDERPTGS